MLAYFSLLVPQILIKPLGGNISTIDMLAPLILAFCFLKTKIHLNSVSKWLIVFIIYLLTSFFINAVTYGYSSLYLDRSTVLLRTVAIWGPLFLVPYLPADGFPKAARWFAIISISATAFASAAYTIGYDGFNAHQTLQFAGTKGLTQRLGGFVGETGNFAFTAFVGFAFAVVFLVSCENKFRKRIFYAVIAAISFYLALRGSVARVMILNVATLFTMLYFSKFANGYVKLFTLFLGSFAVAFVSQNLEALSKFRALERLFSSNTGSFNALSSGRGAHWVNSIELWTLDLSNLLFGVGNRMSGQILGHVVENVFIYHLVSYGVIGTIIFFIFFATLLAPILKYSLRKNPIAQGMFAIWFSVLIQWQFNDINHFYQTFPALILLTAWCGKWLKNQS